MDSITHTHTERDVWSSIGYVDHLHGLSQTERGHAHARSHPNTCLGLLREQVLKGQVCPCDVFPYLWHNHHSPTHPHTHTPAHIHTRTRTQSPKHMPQPSQRTSAGVPGVPLPRISQPVARVRVGAPLLCPFPASSRSLCVDVCACVCIRMVARGYS